MKTFELLSYSKYSKVENVELVNIQFRCVKFLEKNIVIEMDEILYCLNNIYFVIKLMFISSSDI